MPAPSGPGIQSPDLERAMQVLLGPGEEISWSAQPRKGAFIKASLPMFLFGIPFFGFAAYWTTLATVLSAANSRSDAVFFPLIGSVLLAGGLAMLLAPIGACIRAARTAYAITNCRAILIQGHLRGGRTVRKYTFAALDKMKRVDRHDGSGDIIFEPVVYRWGGSRYPRHTPYHRKRGFLGINDVQAVDRILRDLIDSGA